MSLLCSNDHRFVSRQHRGNKNIVHEKRSVDAIYFLKLTRANGEDILQDKLNNTTLAFRGCMLIKNDLAAQPPLQGVLRHNL